MAFPNDVTVTSAEIDGGVPRPVKTLEWHAAQPIAAGTNAIGKLVANAGITIGAVEIAAAQTLATLTNLSQIGGQAVAMGTGVRSAGTQRVTIAIDDVVPASQSGTWNIGTITTLPALVAGTALIGKVGLDQTTDGTTNKVNIDASLKSGTATRTTVNSGTSSVTIIASNANRKGATIFNSDANALLLDLSAGTAASTRCQVRLTQYQTYEMPSGFTGAVTGIWEADGAGIADVVEFT
jgi:hypothetical protein